MTEHAFARQIRPARPRLRTILGATVLAAGLSLARCSARWFCILSTSALAVARMGLRAPPYTIPRTLWSLP